MRKSSCRQKCLDKNLPNNLENQKNQNFEKLKKPPGDIIILRMCTINDNHMIFGSWDIKCDRQIFLSFWTIFCSKNQNFEKMKKVSWRYYHFTYVYHKWQSYNVWFLRYEVWQTDFLSFWMIFCSFTPLTTWKIKILKNWKKNPSRYYPHIKTNQYILTNV